MLYFFIVLFIVLVVKKEVGSEVLKVNVTGESISNAMNEYYNNEGPEIILKCF